MDPFGAPLNPFADPSGGAGRIRHSSKNKKVFIKIIITKITSIFLFRSVQLGMEIAVENLKLMH